MKKLMLAAASVAMLASTMLVAPRASAQDAYDPDTDVPPPEVVATLSPVYFGGYPAYWWNGGWHFRNAHGWFHYRAEPAYLRSWRGSHPVFERHYYTTGHYSGGRGGYAGGHRR